MDKFFEGDLSARRHFDIINLTVMPRNEAKEVLIKGFKKAEVTFDERSLVENIDVAGGYPHSIQIIGCYLIDADKDRHIAQDDWDQALKHSTFELTQKDFSDLYDFKGKSTLRETVLNILALTGRSMTKQELKEFVDGKNIYNATCLGELKKSGAIREMPDGSMSLHSMLFRVAILMHLHLQALHNQVFRDMIARFKPTEVESIGNE